MNREPSTKIANRLVVLLGALSLAGYCWASLGLRGGGSKSDLFEFLGLFAGLFGLYFFAIAVVSSIEVAMPKPALILGFALLFRLALLPAGLAPQTWNEDLRVDLQGEEVSYRSFLLYDNDVWRYLWDGHVLASGLDPYRYSPSELEQQADAGNLEALAVFDRELWHEIFYRVSYETYRTVYPPLAQALFALAHAIRPGSVLVWKLLVVIIDCCTCLVFAGVLRNFGQHPARALLYAWNPLVLKELAGSAHLDALMIFFLTTALYFMSRPRLRTRDRWFGLVSFAFAILAKTTPLLAAWLFIRRGPRHGWISIVAVLGVGYLPFLGSLEVQIRSLFAFAREWVFNPGPWLFVKTAFEALSGLDGKPIASALAAGITSTLIVWSSKRDDGSRAHLAFGTFLILGGYVLFSATVMPWYLLWALPFGSVFLGSPANRTRRGLVLAWLALTATSLLSYLIFIDQQEHRWWLWVEYSSFAAVWYWCARSRTLFGSGRTTLA